MTEADRNRIKEPLTIRVDGDTRAELQALASGQKRTVSSLIDEAVQIFLDQQLGRISTGRGPKSLRVRYALLPDTAVLYAFAQLEPDRFREVVERAGLPDLEFVEKPAEWRSLPVDVFSGESDIVEAVNRMPIYWHVMRGASSPPLDWVGPYLQIFVGHCVFIRTDHLREFMSDDDLRQFLEFRASARTGKDLSLRSLAAWAGQSGEATKGRAAVLQEAWQNAIVGCQLGTDYHVAVRRVSAMLAAMLEQAGEAALAAAAREPNPHGIESLERGFADFVNGTVSAFTGNLLQTAELLSDRGDEAVLLAGPSDLRVPSLNTIAGRKGMFEANDPSSDLGNGALQLWSEAVTWFRDEVVMSGSPNPLRSFVEQNFDGEAGARSDQQIEVLRSLMQNWVRWFADPEEAKAFMGGEGKTEELVRYYTELGEHLNPTAQMPAPDRADAHQNSLWKFPFLPDRPLGSRLTRAA